MRRFVNNLQVDWWVCKVFRSAKSANIYGYIFYIWKSIQMCGLTEVANVLRLGQVSSFATCIKPHSVKYTHRFAKPCLQLLLNRIQWHQLADFKDSQILLICKSVSDRLFTFSESKGLPFNSHCFLKNGPIPASFCLFSSFPHYTIQ